MFTNTKSDIGPNPYRVDDHAREEFANLPDHEKRRLGYEDMLARKLQDLVRQCDRTVMRNKEKLRREVAQAMKQRTEGAGRGNREDLIVTVNEEMLEKCASNVAQATLIEEDMASLVEKIERLEQEEKDLTQAHRGGEGQGRKGASQKEEEKEQQSKETEEDPNAVDPRLLAWLAGRRIRLHTGAVWTGSDLSWEGCAGAGGGS